MGIDESTGFEDYARDMVDANQDLVETRAALESAQKRIAELEARIEAEAKEREAYPHWALALLDSANIGLWEWDITIDKITWSDAVLTTFGVTRETFVGTLEAYMGLLHEDDRATVSQRVEQAFADEAPAYFIEHRLVRPDGEERVLSAHGYLFRDTSGKPYRLCGIVQDVTEQKRKEDERAAMQQQIIDSQRENLRQLGAPIIPLAANTLAMPLVGTLTPERAQIVTETLLHAVTERGAEFVILDVTGVPSVDTEVADGLLRVAQAVRLLGAEVALTGMQPGVARALVELGVDMSAFVTKADLQGGIAWARKRGKR
jgi:rsbT co-antagonist protein RsbR